MLGYDDRRRYQAIMYAVVGIVLLMASFVLPWWGMQVESETRNLGNDEVQWHQDAGFGLSISSGISFEGSGTSLYNRGEVTGVVFIMAAILLLLSMVLASLMVTGLLLDMIRRTVTSRLPMLFGVFAVFFCLLAPLLFMLALPVAMEADARQEAADDGDDYEEPDHDDPTKSFFGSREEEDSGWNSVTTNSVNWGGDIGWFLALAASVFLIVAVIMIRPGKTPSPPLYPPEGAFPSETQPSQEIRRVPPPPETGQAPPPMP